MFKMILVSVLLAMPLSSFAAPGEISVMVEGVSADSISFKSLNSEYMTIGDRISFGTDRYDMDIPALQSKVLQARSQDLVVDVLRKEKSGDPSSSDSVFVNVRPATVLEKENAVQRLRLQNVKLQEENSALRAALKSLSRK